MTRKTKKAKAGASRSTSRRRRQVSPPAQTLATNARPSRRARRSGAVQDPQESDHDEGQCGSQERRSRRDTGPASSSSRTGSAPSVPMPATSTAAKKKIRTVSSTVGSKGQGSSLQPKDPKDVSKAEDGSSPSRKRFRRSQAELMLEAALESGRGAVSSPSPVRKPRSRSARHGTSGDAPMEIGLQDGEDGEVMGVPLTTSSTSNGPAVHRSAGQGSGRRSDAADEAMGVPSADPPESNSVCSSTLTGRAVPSNKRAEVPNRKGSLGGPPSLLEIGIQDNTDEVMDALPATSTSSGENTDDNSSKPIGDVAPSSKVPAVTGFSGEGSVEPPAPLENGFQDAADDAMDGPPTAPPAEEDMSIHPDAPSNDQSSPASSEESAAVPPITAPTFPTTISQGNDTANAVHDSGNGESSHLEGLGGDIPPMRKEPPASKSVSVQTTRSPTTTFSQRSGDGDQRDDEGDEGGITLGVSW